MPNLDNLRLEFLQIITTWTLMIEMCLKAEWQNVRMKQVNWPFWRKKLDVAQINGNHPMMNILKLIRN